MGLPSMSRILLLKGALALTLSAGAAFPAPPASRESALAALEHPAIERRAEAVAWLARHGRMDDTELLMKRLRDESPVVRGFAEQGLWLLWGRSGDAQIDRAMARGVEEMQSGRYDQAVATFSGVVRLRPDFAEGWNKRATVHYLAGDYAMSIADCDEVLKRNPQHFGALSGYGQIYFQLGEFGKAIEWWRRALEANPNLFGAEIGIRRAEELLREQRARST
jgi:tetratricopeptide (TPR) repeat protein